MNRKTVSVILILIIILTTAACAAVSTDTVTETTAGTASATEAAETELTDDLPEISYDGYSFRMLSFPEAGGEHTELDVTEQTGDVLNDSIYMANRRIESRFNFKFSQIMAKVWSDVAGMLKKTVTAGDNAYDLVLIVDREAMNLAMQDKYFYSVNELPYINLDKAYWNQNAQKAMSIEGNLYFTYAANNLPFFDYTCFLVYNKTIKEKYNIEDLYSLVRAGKWTMDKYYSLCADVTADLDGNGKFTDNDQYGVVCTSDYYYPSFWYAEGIPLIAKDENDLPYFNVPGNSALFELFDALYNYAQTGVELNLYSDPLDVYSKVTTSKFQLMMRIFADGRSLFASSSTYLVQSLRGMDADYGIIPYPTFTEGKPYSARVTGGIPTVVPVTVPDPEMASVVLEALACEYQNNVMPKYYDMVVQEKATRDDESREMLKIIYDNRFVDLGDSIWMSMTRSQYESLFVLKSNTFASKTVSIEKQINKTLEDSIEAFRSIAG